MVALRLNDWNVRRSVGLLRYQLEMASDYGLTAETCLEGSGIPSKAMSDPLYEISASQVLAASRRFVQLLGDLPGIALDAGGRLETTHCGILGSMVQSSPTLRRGFDLAFEHIELTRTLNDINARDVDGDRHLVINDRCLPEDVRQFLVEVDIVGLCAVTSDILRRKDAVKRVEFRFPEPAYVDRFREYFHCPVLFGREENVIVLDAAVVDAPLPRAYDSTARAAEQQCREILARRSGRGGVAGQVRSLLLNVSGTIPSLEEVASSLALAPRTLRLHLQGEGTSFRELANEVRRMLAEELLRSSNLTVEEIGERLGYAEPSSFFKAFKRWNGVPPRAYLRAQSTSNVLS